MPKIRYPQLLIVTILLILSGCSRPDFHLLNGDAVRIADHKGKWVVINYWAEWCKPCLDEVPYLNQFYQQIDGKLLFYSISYDKDTNEALLQQKERYGIEYPIIATNPAPQINIPRPAALPANYLIAPDGKTYGPILGPQDAESMIEMFEKTQAEWLASNKP